MPSRGKAKGSEWERQVVKYLREQGWLGAERTRAGWQDDRGDIDGVIGVTFECKNQKNMDLAGWVNELVVEMANGKTNVGAVVHKRRGTTEMSDAYATMPLQVFVKLLQQAGY
jgi:Holliday junction resolvase